MFTLLISYRLIYRKRRDLLLIVDNHKWKEADIDIKLGKWERIKRKRNYLPLSLFRGSVAIVTNVAKV